MNDWSQRVEVNELHLAGMETGKKWSATGELGMWEMLCLLSLLMACTRE